MYKDLFEEKGYSDVVDVENLKGLDKEDLRHMGITRRGKWSKSLCYIVIHIL